ncbi:RNA polymerase sigma factor [Mucilaginibacter gossypii]|uniref:DNA-directed RNA polymerase specialized sigma subunit, sigma24 family n=1 Tax=Mucilaginibacter gossypii TaxID=551996 RepID=A0A1G7RNS8_9SPHI|nr:sigma-70 family RNA polymerase sigma factor [Mucilaginibacter gossypii]SDG11859.1 DNA-directed RNA polymerase specialized sigma subunit, sigma24 family [Mucilaginibacter gossypii]
MLADTDDGALLGLLHNKNTRREAFEQVLKKYQQKIYFFLRRTGLEHEVTDELVQDVFLKFWKLPNAEQESNSLIITLYRLSVARLKNSHPAGLQGLTQQEQIIVVLKTQEDFDFQEIAQIVAIPVNEVRSLFKTGIIKINDQL